MLVYNVLAVLSLVLKPLLKDRKLYMVIMCTLMVLVAGGRSVHVGSDTVTYVSIYENIKTLTMEDSFILGNKTIEIGEVLISMLAYEIYDSPQTYFFLMALFTMGSLFFFLYRTAGEDYHIAVFVILTLGFFSYMLNAGRQALGIAVACHGLYYMFNHSYARALIVALLGTCFHVSIVIMIPVIALIRLCDRETGRKGRIATLLFLLIIMGIGFYAGYNYLLNNLDLLDAHYASYFSVASEFSAEIVPRGTLIFSIFGVYAIMALQLVLVRTEQEQYRKNFIVAVMLLVAVILFLGQINVAGLFFRLITTFSFYMCLAVPYTFRLFKNSMCKDILMLVFIFLSLVLMNYLGIRGVEGIYPYSFAL